jgi:hypothetical protein
MQVYHRTVGMDWHNRSPRTSNPGCSCSPGAFSAYRYKALENDISGNGPLKQYFLGETMERMQGSCESRIDEELLRPMIELIESNSEQHG